MSHFFPHQSHPPLPPAAPPAPPFGAHADAPGLIHALIPALSPHSRVRQSAEALLNGMPPSRESVECLFTALADPAGRSRGERVVAAWALGQAPLSPEERDAAAHMLLEILESHTGPTFGQQFLRALVAGYGLIALGCLLHVLNLEHYWIPRHMILERMLIIYGAYGSPFVLSGAGLFAGATQKDDDRLRAMAAHALGSLGVAESVGALAGTLFTRSPRVNEASASALHRLLPALTEAHYGLFGSDSMAKLGRALDHPDSLLVSKVLSALEKVGTRHAIPFAEKLARTSRMTRQRDAAAHLAEVLRGRQQSELASDTLMRPVAATMTAPDQLLRASQGSNDAAQQQILRARQSDE